MELKPGLHANGSPAFAFLKTCLLLNVHLTFKGEGACVFFPAKQFLVKKYNDWTYMYYNTRWLVFLLEFMTNENGWWTSSI